MKNTVVLKQQLHHLCGEHITERVNNIREAIELAQEAAHEETKSSAGDKYETGRAMMQLEIENQMLQMAEAEKLKKALDQINPLADCDTVVTGSLVTTSIGTFYLSVSVGKLTIDGKDYMAVSPSSPIGSLMLNREKGATVTFNGKEIRITDIG